MLHTLPVVPSSQPEWPVMTAYYCTGPQPDKSRGSPFHRRMPGQANLATLLHQTSSPHTKFAKAQSSSQPRPYKSPLHSYTQIMYFRIPGFAKGRQSSTTSRYSSSSAGGDPVQILAGSTVDGRKLKDLLGRKHGCDYRLEVFPSLFLTHGSMYLHCFV